MINMLIHRYYSIFGIVTKVMTCVRLV